MSTPARATRTPERLAWQVRLRSRVVALAVVTLLLGVSLLPTADVSAAVTVETMRDDVAIQPPPTPAARGDVQLVFSIGTLAGVGQQAITLAFDNGQTETYQLGPATTVQTQNGDAQALTDLDLGATVIVIADETSQTAITIVNGGDSGFYEAGPADIRGHTDPCAPCGPESASPSASPAPSPPPLPGPPTR